MKPVTPQRPDTEANMIGDNIGLTIHQIVRRTYERTIRTEFQWINPEWKHQDIATSFADGTLVWRYEQDVIVVRSAAELERIAVLRELDDDEEETDEATIDIGFVIQPTVARD